MTATAGERPVVHIDYTAHPRQAAAHTTYCDELLYGGAAGGGKSRFARAEAIAFALEVPGSATLILRESFPKLSKPGAMIPKMREEMPRKLATYNGENHEWTLRNGSTITFGYLDRDASVGNYQGAEFQLIIIDEGTQISEYRYRYMLSRLRASGAVEARLAELGYRPRMIVTANPGGIGHEWVKARWIDPAPPNVVWRPAPTEDDPEPGTRCFIPAKVDDNPSIDKGYAVRLNRLPPDERRMLKDGDWDVYQGQRFRHFRRAIHVIDPEDLPLSLGGIRRGMGVDYGMDAPFAALWGASLSDGLVVVYRELYAPELTPDEQAAAIEAAEAPGERDIRRPIPIALDPSTWARNPHVLRSPKPPKSTRVGGEDPDEPPPGSIAAAYRSRFGNAVMRANNDRLAGVALVSDKLRVRDDGLPRILIYSTCRNLIRTLPSLPRDTRRPEDVDTKAEDHAYDALRYLLMLLESHGGSPGSDTSPLPGPSTRYPVPQEPSTVTGGLGRSGF